MSKIKMLSFPTAIIILLPTFLLGLTGCGGGGPVIVNIEYSLSGSSAVITWDTGVNTTSQIEYGTTTEYGNLTTEDTTLVANHTVTVNDLEPLTTYHFRVCSKDASGVETISEDVTFTTGGAVISAVTSSDITINRAKITWATNKSATSQVEYGATASYGSTTTVNSSLTTNHSVNLGSLESETTYHYRVRSKDGDGMETMSADNTFQTLTASGILKVSILDFPTTNNPFTDLNDQANAWHIGIMYEPLVMYSESGILAPLLAESWTYNHVTLIWTITIDPDAIWNDGHPVTATDVKFTYDKFKELEIEYGGARGSPLDGLIQQITVVDSRTVNFELTEHSGAFPVYLSDVPITPEHVWGDMTNNEITSYANTTPVASGAWLLRERVLDSHVTYDAFPDYWRGSPKIDELTLQYYSSEEDQCLAFKSGGNIDAMAEFGLGTSAVPLLIGVSEIIVYQTPKNDTMTFYMNHRHEPWNLAAFRKAVSIGINRNGLISFAANGWAITPNNIEVAPHLNHATEDIEWPYSGNTAAELTAMANAALDAISGMSDTPNPIPDPWIRTYNGTPLEFTFECTTSTEDSTAAELVADDLADIGIKMNVTPISANALIARTFRQKSNDKLDNWEVFAWGRPFTPEYDYFANQWSLYEPDDSTRLEKRGYVMGWSGTTAEAIDAKFDILQSLPLGNATRDAHIEETQELIADELPCIPLYHRIAPNAHWTDNFTGWVLDSGIIFNGAVPSVISPDNLLSIEPL